MSTPTLDGIQHGLLDRTPTWSQASPRRQHKSRRKNSKRSNTWLAKLLNTLLGSTLRFFSLHVPLLSHITLSDCACAAHPWQSTQWCSYSPTFTSSYRFTSHWGFFQPSAHHSGITCWFGLAATPSPIILYLPVFLSFKVPTHHYLMDC